jgi:hypothetical protein
MAEYRRGTGPKQLPQGAASAVNAATPSPAQPIDIPVQYATEADRPQLPPDGQNDNLDILTAPPHPGYQAAGVQRSNPMAVPKSVIRNLPRLMVAARDPDASTTLKALYYSIVWELERQQTS